MKAPPSSTKDCRVLLVDDHPLVRLGLAASLKRMRGVVVCDAVPTAEEALRALERHHPDLLITDMNLPGKSGFEWLKELCCSHPRLPVIVLSVHDEEMYAQRCLQAGARAYVMKNESIEILTEAIRQVMAGGIHVSARTSALILENLTRSHGQQKRAPLAQLSARELEVFQWLGRGFSTREISRQLHVGIKTIETHRMHIKKKMGFASATAMTAFAARWIASDP